MLLAIDPGRDKCGIAVMTGDAAVIFQEIVATEKIESYLLELLNRYKIEEVVLGNGTFSEEVARKIEKNYDLPLMLIKEAYTTLAAEERYRQVKYSGIKRFFLSFIKWKPSFPVDDYAAVILGERYLKDKGL
ncbi:Holliday junction resolvase RuvX [Iocasia frigidifontis]|uniref:Holliday junction resolvase RuvX n=1 Tax=Iocasia fonsfrigidae TaxID=2682810 RepID=A0A8A7K566_9FIRM|nr:RuvX/YqgF family protein [Iocasia fonsfrigidae]QTL96903.1 Holliday junction resolvase RuvX [Iocasia fonsfrigidae]